MLRFLAVSMVLLSLVSLVRPARWPERLRRHGWWGPALALSGATRRRDGGEGAARREPRPDVPEGARRKW